MIISEACSNAEWQAGCGLLHEVYVGGGFTAHDAAQRVMTRENLEKGGTFLIAKRDDGGIMGAVLFLHEESDLRQLARDGEREFRMLGVDARARGEGAGEALVKACKQRAAAENATALVLWTQPSMHAAHRLYERLGFVRDPSRDMLDPRGFTRLVYVLKLM